MKHSILLALLLLISPLSWADAHFQTNIIQLSASADTKTSNDELITQLQVIETGHDTAKLTKQVNNKTKTLLSNIKTFKHVHVKTTGFNTSPRYTKDKISSWQVSQRLTLTTKDFKQMSQLLEKVNGLANIKSMQFHISDKKQKQIKSDLLKQAIGNFKQQALMLAKQFGFSSYQLVNLSVRNNYYQPVAARSVRADYVMLSESVSSKQKSFPMASGDNKLTVTISGSIQLK